MAEEEKKSELLPHILILGMMLFIGGVIASIVFYAPEIIPISFLREALVEEFSNDKESWDIVLIFTLSAGSLGVGVLAVAIFMVPIIYIFDLENSNIRLSIEKKKKDATDSFDDEQKKILDKILKEKNEEKKQELEQQALALRQEYESLVSENLRRRDGNFVTDWRESLLVARKRLADEGLYLRASNSTNRRMGVLMASLGIGSLVYYILSSDKLGENDGLEVFFASYWPFFTIVIIFEVIAIFYLRLYYQILRRIETNKNELTNIELRLTAGLMLCDVKDKTKLKSLADTLAKEERNFVLGKNESSAGIGVDRVAEILSKVIKGGI
ncbi:MAG: hypothetical protein K8953_11100 [Proteobacteria bacterium]|nr:hypothetical protein [Pseudomonadota bacterium]